MKKYIVLLTLALLLITGKAHAWGSQGHSIIALIAQQVLTDQANKNDAQAASALKAIANILDGTPIDEGATWPDRMREEARDCKDPQGQFKAVAASTKKGVSPYCDAYAATADWHFINTGTDTTSYSYPTNGDGDLVVILRGLTHLLKNEPSDVLANVTSFQNWKTQCLSQPGHTCKKEALEFILHLVGDIHQPLHVGASCDAGGNDQLIVFFGQAISTGASWCQVSNPPPNCGAYELHAAWDSGLLLFESAASQSSSTDSSFSNSGYATKLANTESGKTQSTDNSKCVTTPPAAAVNVDGDNGPETWANESICYNPQAYIFPDETPAPIAPPSATPAAPTKATGKSSFATSDVQSDKPIILRLIAQASVAPNRCQDSRKSIAGKYPTFSAFQVGQRYYNANMPTIDERLYWAGNRLATLLKQIYGNGDPLSGDISP